MATPRSALFSSWQALWVGSPFGNQEQRLLHLHEGSSQELFFKQKTFPRTFQLGWEGQIRVLSDISMSSEISFDALCFEQQGLFR